MNTRWFSFQITEEDCPWAFAKDPFRVIATLELVATLVGLILLVPSDLNQMEGNGSVAVGCGTDNRGNALGTEKWMTTKYPSCNVLIGLSEQLHVRGLTLRLGWVPREGNQLADDLTSEVGVHKVRARPWGKGHMTRFAIHCPSRSNEGRRRVPSGRPGAPKGQGLESGCKVLPGPPSRRGTHGDATVWT